MENPLTYEEISLFEQTSKKSKNDYANKRREKIICEILNNLIPVIWYIISDEWKKLKNELLSIIKILSGLKTIYKIICKKMGGRGNHFDFILYIYINARLYMTEKIEFKFNAKLITGTSQFLSLPEKSENFILLRCESYGEHFYDTCIHILTQVYGLPHISRVDYVDNVYKNKCKHEWFNKLKKQETNIKKKSIKTKIVHESIDEYLTKNINKIDIDQFNEKLYSSQKNKKYILYCPKTKKFYTDTITDEELTIVSVYLKKKRTNLYIICDTLNPNTELHVLLRWKNTNGILFPAWQISIKRSNK